MKIYKDIAHKVWASTQCDICNKKCSGSDPVGVAGHGEFATLKGFWGYYSKKDGIAIECHMCEECCDKVTEFIETLGGTVRSTPYDITTNATDPFI